MRGRTIGTIGLVALTAIGCNGDSVHVTGGDGQENGVLVDGSASGAQHVWDRNTGPDGSSITVGPFDAPIGELIAYTVGHAPTVQPTVAWTSGADNIGLAFDPKYRVKFQIWVVQGPFAQADVNATNACIRTSQIWRDERQGTAFSAFTITDATSNSHAGSYTAFTCGAVPNIKTDIGFDPAAVNVYWVNTVDFGSGAATSNGVWCGGNVVGMGFNVLDHLFSHEIGHSFGLAHVNTITQFFDPTNVMHNASNFRRWLTEGQTFRAVADPGSVVNTLAGRTGPTRVCDEVSTSVTDPQCPALQKRVWADGAAWPPN